jgi:hypothetical protein
MEPRGFSNSPDNDRRGGERDQDTHRPPVDLRPKKLPDAAATENARRRGMVFARRVSRPQRADARQRSEDVSAQR